MGNSDKEEPKVEFKKKKKKSLRKREVFSDNTDSEDEKISVRYTTYIFCIN